MDYLIINKIINIDVIINKSSIKDVLKLIPNFIENIKINKKKDIQIVRGGENIKITLDFYIKGEVNLSDKIIEMKKTIEDLMFRLFGFKIYNISLNYLGRY